MKASELVALLQKMIKHHGDQDIVLSPHDEWRRRCDGLETLKRVASNVETVDLPEGVTNAFWIVPSGEGSD